MIEYLAMSISGYLDDVNLEQCQISALNHIQCIAVISSNEAREEVLMKIRSINSNNAEQTLSILNTFIEHRVPITIRVHCNKMKQLSQDTHYRNLFETGTSGGTTCQKSRQNGENRKFGNAYDSVDAFDRPKYGCLNIGLQSYGCHRASHYGDAYFVLNNDTVRGRITITFQNSLGLSADQVGTLKYHNHLLKTLSDEELKELIDTALYGTRGDYKQKSYREIQIHGPIQLNRDIYSLHVPQKYRFTADQVVFKQFAEEKRCKLVWF